MSAIVAVMFNNDDEMGEDEQEVIDTLSDVSDEFDCKTPEEIVDLTLACMDALKEIGLEPDVELNRDELVSGLYSEIAETIGDDLISIDIDMFDKDNEKYEFSLSFNQGYNVSILLRSENVEDDEEDDDGADFNEEEDELKEFF
jgi:hypothetical protein